MDMTGQILPFYRPEFSVMIEMTGHFFSSATGVFVRDNSKALEQHLNEYLVSLQVII